MIHPFRSLAAGCVLILLALPAGAFETSARAAFVLDQTTGTVLMAKNADDPLPPASMSKLMTIYIAFEALRDGRLTLDERLPVSEHAVSYKGSSMFLTTRDRVRVEDLLQGIVVLSGNDACVVIAEALSPDGTEAGFARFMTKRAKLLGMTHSFFANSNGWPGAGDAMSVRDLVTLADHLITDFPQFYPLFSEKEFKFDDRVPANTHNRNPLLSLGIGADGLKTGHTSEAGYGLVGSAKQGDRRVIFVLSGLASKAQRASEGEAIINWSFRNFTRKTVAKAGAPIARADIWMGREGSVNLVPQGDVSILLPALSTGKVTGEVVYVGPIEAPVLKGQILADLIVTPEGLPAKHVPLIAERDVPRGGFLVRIGAAAAQLLTRITDGPREAL